MDVLVQWFVLLVCFAGGFCRKRGKRRWISNVKIRRCGERGGRKREEGGSLKGGQRGVKRRSNWTDPVLIRRGDQSV
jgi:hypothetical protein